MWQRELPGIILLASVFVGVAAAWMIPGLLKLLWVRRQNALLASIRAHYVLGEQAVLGGDMAMGQAALADMDVLDRRWLFGNSKLARVLVGVIAFVAGWSTYMVFRVGGLWLNGWADDNWFLLVLGAAGAMHGVTGLYSFDNWRNRDEPEGLNARLEQMLGADRGLSHRPKQRKRKDQLMSRNLFGLGATFTQRELDRARRKLAMVHHPDRWAHASKDVQRAHEDAMKRINSAYEALSKANV